MDKAREIFDEVVADWIGSPPPVYHKLHQAIQNPDSSFADFSNIAVENQHIRVGVNIIGRVNYTAIFY